VSACSRSSSGGSCSTNSRAAMRSRITCQALHADALLQRRWALDSSLMEFVQRARNVDRTGNLWPGLI
jgi:hypothetical protein